MTCLHRELAEVEDARGEHRVGVGLDDRLGEVLELARAAARDDRDVDAARDRARQRDVEAVLGAVAVHAREQDLARAETLGLARPLDGVELGVDAAAVDEDLPAVAPARDAARVDGDDDALRAVDAARLR